LRRRAVDNHPNLHIQKKRKHQKKKKKKNQSRVDGWIWWTLACSFHSVVVKTVEVAAEQRQKTTFQTTCHLSIPSAALGHKIIGTNRSLFIVIMYLTSHTSHLPIFEKPHKPLTAVLKIFVFSKTFQTVLIKNIQSVEQ